MLLVEECYISETQTVLGTMLIFHTFTITSPDFLAAVIINIAARGICHLNTDICCCGALAETTFYHLGGQLHRTDN